MENFEKYKFNVWDVLTMIPIFLCAFIVNNALLSYAFIFMGIVGIIHHMYVNIYRILILDTISILVMSIVFTIIISKFPQYIKDILYFLEISVFVFLLFCFIFNVKYPNRILLIIISLVWLPLTIFTVKYISHTSGFIAIFTLFLYMSSVTICGENPFVKFSWPLIHGVFALVAFLVLYETDLLRPEIYTPIQDNLDYFIGKKENNQLQK